MNLSWKSSLVALLIGGLVIAAIGARLVASARTNPNALWDVVHGVCVPAARTTRKPGPCAAVDLADGYAVLKDLRGATQVLVIPTERVSGIESAALLAPGSPNYWADAWSARSYVAGYAHRPVQRDDVALVVNSAYGRSQNQLHIHVDCVRPEVAAALKASLHRLGPSWSRFTLKLDGRRYRAMWLAGADLEARDPFKLLARDPSARADMGAQTLAVVGITAPDGTPGFVLLSHAANLATGDNGHAEELMDHGCRVLGAASSL
jgi:CDP-diacylglycerol pyrophosphatase